MDPASDFQTYVVSVLLMYFHVFVYALTYVAVLGYDVLLVIPQWDKLLVSVLFFHVLGFSLSPPPPPLETEYDKFS